MKITFDLDNEIHRRTLFTAVYMTLGWAQQKLSEYNKDPDKVLHKSASPERHAEYKRHLEEEIALLQDVAKQGNFGTVTITC